MFTHLLIYPQHFWGMKFHVISAARGYFIVISWKFSTRQEIEDTSISKDNKWNTAVLLMYLFSFLLTPFLFYSTPSLLIYDFFFPPGRSTNTYRRNIIKKIQPGKWNFYLYEFHMLLQNGYETSKDRGLCAGEFSEGTIQGFCGTGSYEKLQVKKEGRSCAVFPWIGAVTCRIRAEQEPTADLQIG